MKRVFLFLLLMVVIGGCNIFPNNQPGESSQLTPYMTAISTQETLDNIANGADGIDAPTDTPEPTATPTIHMVELGETLSSIAWRYGVSIDAILSANPDITPNAMIVDDTVIIPAAEAENAAELVVEYIDQIQFGKPTCMMAGDVLWCGAMVNNKSDTNLQFPVVVFRLIDQDGNTVAEKKTPALLQEIQRGASIPVTTTFETDFSEYDRVDISLFSIEESESASLEVAVEDPEREIGQYAATISGSVEIISEESIDRANLKLVAAIFDKDGYLIGTRRNDQIVATNERFDGEITAYSVGPRIVDIILYTEAYSNEE